LYLSKCQGLYEVKSKRSKRKQIKKKKKVAGLKAPDSSVHGLANGLLSGILACVDYNSLDGPREAPDSLVCQPLNN
jgi:hypothetical protein